MTEAPSRVLIVDDDASFGGMVAEILTEKGFEATLCAKAEEALERAARLDFAAAVVDLVMPQMGGLELTKRLKSVRPDVQIVILTGHADMGSAIEGIHAGIFDYLQKKDIQIARLERTVRSAVERHQLTRQNRELLGQLKESNRLLKALHEINATLSGEPHLDRLLQHLVASAQELTGARSGRVLLLRRQGEDLVIETSVGDGADTLRGARLRAGEGVAMLALEGGEGVLVEDARRHARYSHRCDEMPAGHTGLLCAPLLHGTARGVVMVAGRKQGVLSAEDREVLAILGRQAAVAIDNAQQHERAINFFTHASEILISFLESMDVFYRGHSRGVAALSDMVTRRLGLSDVERRNIHFGALLHDIGKVMVDPAILKTSGYASEDVRAQLQRHPALGLELLRPITVWEDILPVILAHHERWDGKGYPRGLKGEEIPLGARVVAVADAFDAMTRDTPHGPHRTAAEALAELEAFSGTQFDARMVRLFVAEFRNGDPRLTQG